MSVESIWTPLARITHLGKLLVVAIETWVYTNLDTQRAYLLVLMSLSGKLINVVPGERSELLADQQRDGKLGGSKACQQGTRF